MRNATSAPLIDWIVVSARWLILLVITIFLAAGASLELPILLVLLLAALINLSLNLLAATERRPAGHMFFSVAADLLVAMLLFFFGGLLDGRLAWAGILPLVSAGLYFQWLGILLALPLTLLIQVGLALLVSSQESTLLSTALLLPIYLVLGLMVGIVSRRLAPNRQARPGKSHAGRRGAEKGEDERRHTIFNLISALSSSLNYQRVLNVALDLSTNALGGPSTSADRMVCAVLLFAQTENKTAELQVGSARRFTTADMRITLPGTGGLIGRSIDEGKATFSKEVAKDPELGRIVAMHTCQAGYCIPLRTGMDTYGVLLFAHPEGDFFTPERRELLDIVGNQAVIAFQNARLYQDLEQEKERMMEIQEEARKKMARDLHDGPTQSVAAIAMRVNFARRLLDRDAKSAAEELFKIEELARRTTKEIRHMLFTLRPLVLESQGLQAALDSMAEKMRETYNQNVIIQADARICGQLEPAKQAVVFYIAEEAVNNARKHAKAAHIWVRLKPIMDGMALLEIEDDGVGFNVGAVDASYENRGSLGMVNMRERTELVNGVLHIDSAEGRGTRIQVAIPLTDEAADRIRRGQ